MQHINPEPNDDLNLVIETKRSSPSLTVDIVSSAALWIKASLLGADVHFTCSSCEERPYYGFATFTVIRTFKKEPVSLDLRVAEINNIPYAFAEVKSMGQFSGPLFPYFGEIASDHGRNNLLHYVADFILSTEPKG